MPKRAEKPRAEENLAVEPQRQAEAAEAEALGDAEPEDTLAAGEDTPDGQPVDDRERDAAELLVELEAAEAKAAEHWDRLLRTQAEMENLRKRAQRDVEHAHKYALEGFATELLGVKDSLEMGLAAADQEESDIGRIREGTELTLRMLEQVMDKFAIRAIDPIGEKFDPELHQAMTLVESDNAEPNTVLSVIQKGYVLNDRLIRPALVTVAKSA